MLFNKLLFNLFSYDGKEESLWGNIRNTCLCQLEGCVSVLFY